MHRYDRFYSPADLGAGISGHTRPLVSSLPLLLSPLPYPSPYSFTVGFSLLRLPSPSRFPFPLPLVHLGVWERCNLPQKGPAGAPAANAFLTIFNFLTPEIGCTAYSCNRYSNCVYMTCTLAISYKLPNAHQPVQNSLQAEEQ